MIRLFLIPLFFLSTFVHADIFDQFNDVKNTAFSHYGLKLESNESILENLPDCEPLKNHSMFTHRCYDKTKKIPHHVFFFKAG